MRLTSKEIFFIKSAIQNNLEFPFKVFLFGSRTNDTKKGGDIDLLILVENLEQKIDITVTTPKALKTDVFFQSIADELIAL